MAFDFKKEYKEFYMPKNKPEIVKYPVSGINRTWFCLLSAVRE